VSELFRKPSDAVEDNVKNLIAWAESREASYHLSEVMLCPKELKEGNITDYVSEAYSVLEAYEKNRFEDISNVIL